MMAELLFSDDDEILNEQTDVDLDLLEETGEKEDTTFQNGVEGDGGKEDIDVRLRRTGVQEEKGEKEKNEDVKYDPVDVVKKVRLRSLAWKFFYFKGTESSGPNKNRVFCKLCDEKKRKKDISCSYCGATSNLIDHLKKYHGAEYAKAEEEENKKEVNKKTNVITNFFGRSAKNIYKWPKSSKSWKDLTTALAKWLCVNSRSSLMVEDSGFLAFIALDAKSKMNVSFARHHGQLYQDIRF